MDLFYKLFIQFPILLFSITIHEFAHGFMSNKLGDDTGSVMGRLTLNPMAHIDLIGTIILPLISIVTGAPVFGWAKPVPINPYRLNNPKRDMMLIGLAGPASNMLMALLAGLIIKLVTFSDSFAFASPIFQYLLVLNIILAIFNLVPIPPLDGSHIITGLLPSHWAREYEKIGPYGFFIIIFLLMSGILWNILGPIVVILLKWIGGGQPYV
ncbi:MAG: site-2 protease family protein [Elusimicrobiota bacterium]|nr:site-2 protease family protein [Elusimicrobiota bacterium]